MMMNGFVSLYGLCLLVTALICWDVLAIGVRARGLVKGTRGMLYVICLVLGFVCARGGYILTSPYGGMDAGFISLWPYEYAMCGAVLGGVLGGVLTALLTRQSVGYVLDAMTPAGLVTIALGRCAEMFADFGWGAVVEGELARFPFAVPDSYDQWHLSLFFLSAALAVLSLIYAKVWRRKVPGEMFSIALLWWAMGQLFCETLRAESITWGFVRVQQVVCAAMALGMLICWSVKNCVGGKQLRHSLIVYFLCIGAIVFAQYAMDKLTGIIPMPVSYGMMALVLIIMGAVVQRAVCASKQKLLIKVKYKKEA